MNPENGQIEGDLHKCEEMDSKELSKSLCSGELESSLIKLNRLVVLERSAVEECSKCFRD